jgi:hypothetical protein
VFGAKRLSDVRYLKQNNKTKIAAGFKVHNKVFAVTGPDKNVKNVKNVNWREEVTVLAKTLHAPPV